MKHRKQKKAHRTVLTGLIDLVGLGLVAVTLLGFAGRLCWFCDLFSHFRVQYMQICLVLIFIAIWKRLYRRAAALILLAGLNYAFVLPLYFGKPDPATGKPIRAMLMNINASNGNTEQVLGAIKDVAPDLLLLEEVTPKWERELAVLNDAFPYRVAEPQEGCFGMMLLSKVPLEHGRVVQVGTAGVPSIIAEAHFPQGVVAIIGTHPLPPVGSTSARQRNTQLAELPYLVMEQEYPVLLIGDLNVTPFSYWFRRVMAESGLKNSMQGFGYQASWPSFNRFLRIPIDHILYSDGITIHSRAVGGNVGSDHFPVIIDFSL